MTSGEYDNLASSMVFLFEAASIKQVSFEPQELEGLLKPPLTAGVNIDGRLTLTSVADQIQVLLGPERFDVSDLSSKSPGGKPLGRVMVQLVEKFGGSPRAIGFNYEILYPAPGGKASGTFIAEKFLAAKTRASMISVDGAAVTLYYSKEPKRCTMRLEPRRGDPKSNAIYINFNVHEDLRPSEASYPLSGDGGDLHNDFVSEYKQLVELLKRLFEE